MKRKHIAIVALIIGIGVGVSSISVYNKFKAFRNSIEDDIVEEVKVAECTVPTEEISALDRARILAEDELLSKNLTYEQLVSEEGYSNSSSIYAVENLEIDWKQNALIKADLFKSTLDLSKEEIYNRLISSTENFTAEEAQYAIDNIE